MLRTAVIALSLAAALPALAQHPHAATSPYAGQEARDIKSLSAEDIAELRRGGGWGLARAAELNGIPGPAHLLELKDQIALSPEQVTAIQAIHARMRADAIAEGERLIGLERELEAAFRSGRIDQAALRSLLDEIATSQSKLRFIHLATHLTTRPLLTDAQVAKYNQLRGYTGDACANVPEGHDPEMWRRHNGCG